MKEILGIDIGNVITDGRRNDNTDTAFKGNRYLETTSVPNAFEIIAELVQQRFKENVFLVSKAGEKTQKKTKEWLLYQGFYKATGIKPEQVFFCRERIDKAPICRDLGITHFIDDKLEVLGYLTTVPNKFLFNPREREVQRNIQHLDEVTWVSGWLDIKQLLLG